MKTILIIQTLIIIAGAYYFYTQMYKKDAEPVIEERVIEEPVTPVVSEASDVTAEATSTVSTELLPIAGPNDAGMEWPTIEGELQAQ
jgi:hypothetical protein